MTAGVTQPPAPAEGPRIAVVDYGIGNLRSAEKALQRVGAQARLTGDPVEVEGADAVVLPGVGAFGACMDALRATGLHDVTVQAAASGRPFLGICVGMQLLYEESDESPDHSGLGILAGRITPLARGVKRPQMQWNRLDVTDPAHPLVEGADGSWVYFVHSYRAPLDERVIATCDYGDEVAAVVASDNVWATQFHPEKSGPSGLRLLGNFVSSVRSACEAGVGG